MSYGIHWFRRDLRIVGNPALASNFKRHSGKVLGLFVFDPAFLSRPDLGKNRFAFFLETLGELRGEMRALGGDLLVLDQGPEQAFQLLLDSLRERGKPHPGLVSLNRDYEPFARSRDAKIEALLKENYGIEVLTERDHLLIEPSELEKDRPGTWYQVYSPFQKKWLQHLGSREVQSRIAYQKAAIEASAARRKDQARFQLEWKDFLPSSSPSALKDTLEGYRKKLRAETDIKLPPAGHTAAMERLRQFAESGLERYAEQRDFPAIEGTSQLSIYLKNGSLTVPQIIAELGLGRLAQGPRDRSAATPDSKIKFLNELIWREFYYHILSHCPRVETEAFQARYKNIAWENDPELFNAWCEGKTGYPIVDAAMRQLNTTGWMHNRMRMVVASFLTKDLLIDWRWGERYFMQKLLDGDLAPNNGGWQWAASTGCDPQPYFRVFNPTLQGKRYDKDGDYVRKFVPELSAMDSRFIHEPWKCPKSPHGYPAPIVDHARQSRKAIALFKSISRTNS